MPKQYVPDEVREFITKHIDSVAQIEALLLISSRPEQCWSTRQIAMRLYTSDEETARALEELCTGRLLVCTEGNYRLNASAENVDMIRRLQEAHARYLVPVTDVIHRKSRSEASARNMVRIRKDV